MFGGFNTSFQQFVFFNSILIAVVLFPIKVALQQYDQPFVATFTSPPVKKDTQLLRHGGEEDFIFLFILQFNSTFFSRSSQLHPLIHHYSQIQIFPLWSFPFNKSNIKYVIFSMHLFFHSGSSSFICSFNQHLQHQYLQEERQT